MMENRYEICKRSLFQKFPEFLKLCFIASVAKRVKDNVNLD